MKPGQLPDRPPRRRERPKWPKLLLIAGFTLTVAGFFLTFGPLAPDLGGTDSPPLDEPAGDPSGVDAGDERDETGDTDGNGDEATGTGEIDGSEDTGIRELIGKLTAGDDDTARADDDGARKECVVE